MTTVETKESKMQESTIEKNGASENEPEARSEIQENGIRTIVDYLTSVPAWYLATCEGDQPHVRPFSFAAEQDGRIWFCTATTKDVYRELTNNPKLELTAWKPGSGWIILRGKADLNDCANDDVRLAGFEHLVALGESYDGPQDETLTFFSVVEAQAWLCDIDGSWNPL